MLLHQVRRLNRMNHVLLNCHVTPKSKTPSITVDDTSGVPIVNVKVLAPPDKGKANKAVLEALADKLRVKSSKLSIQSGATSRSKVVQLETDADLSTILSRIRYFYNRRHLFKNVRTRKVLGLRVLIIEWLRDRF